MKHAAVKIVRFFEEFDFMSLPHTRLQAHNPLSLRAFALWPPRGTGDALSLLMLKKNEKLIAEANPGLTSRTTPLLRLVTGPDFATEVLASKRPVLVEFCTSWSPACQVMDSVLEELTAPKRTGGNRTSQTYTGEFKVVMVDLWKH